MGEKAPLTITTREEKAIQLALYYGEFCEHGTVGHNLIILVGKLARDRGFVLDESLQMVIRPEDVVVTEK